MVSQVSTWRVGSNPSFSAYQRLRQILTDNVRTRPLPPLYNTCSPTTNPWPTAVPGEKMSLSRVAVVLFSGLCPCSLSPVLMGLVPLYLPASLVVVKVHECPAG